MAEIDDKLDDRCWPIIYVRGYAMTQGEIDDTTADPFCGFNLGSTVYRATPDKRQPPRKFVFESPVVRLRSDFKYSDVYEDGIDIVDPDWDRPDGGEPRTIGRRSIVVYRYYDSSSGLLGDKKRKPMRDFAKGLSDLILRVRELVCANRGNQVKPADFRCFLVAHSMGGLVCRAFLQNKKLGDAAARACVDKLFTYATPHNGIELAGFNVPSWLTAADMDNFNRKEMASYLDLGPLHDKTERVDWLPESAFPSTRVFCMVGTNRTDYEAGLGASRTFAGHGSDGLVRIENARVWGVDVAGKPTAPCATAYTYRSHSGYFGIVNSEEAYQNLTRFLFGDVRIDVWLDLDAPRLPKLLRADEMAGRKVNALYQIELLAAPRGKRWYLTRRTSEEDSVACRTHQELVGKGGKERRELYLSTIFLAKRARIDPLRKSLAYSLTFGVRVPDYEVEKSFWPDQHYEGGYLFRDTLVVEITPPAVEGGAWAVAHDWQSDHLGVATQPLEGKRLEDGSLELEVPFTSVVTDENGKAVNSDSPAISGTLRFVVSAWS